MHASPTHLKRFLYLLLLLVLPVAAGAQSFSKEAMLRAVAQQTIIPGYSNFAFKATALATAVERFVAAPSTNLLAAARDACGEAIVAWKANACVQGGPVTELDLASKFGFWPTRVQNIEVFLGGNETFTAEAVAGQGVATTSLFAIEYLLSSKVGRGGTRESDEALLKLFTGAAGAPRRGFLVALSRVAADRAKQLADAWSPAGGNYVVKFAKAGQETVGWLVNNLVAGVEEVVEKRLKSVMDLNPAAAPQDLNWIQGAPSGVSQQGALSVLRGARALALGFEPQLRSAGSVLGERIRAQFDRTLAAVEAVGGPLESALPQKKSLMNAAVEEGKKLEVLLKTELVSVLGVTLTFTSGDGD